MEAFDQAGLATMQASERLQACLDRAAERARDAGKRLEEALALAAEAAIDAESDAELRRVVSRDRDAAVAPGLTALQACATDALRVAGDALAVWAAEAERASGVARRAVREDRSAVEKKLAEMGYGAEKLAEFQVLSRRAGMLPSWKTAFADAEAKAIAAREAFEVDLAKRAGLVEDQRAAFVRVAGAVSRQFEDRIRVTRIDCAVSDGLGRLIQELRQKGISQWWNGLDNRHKPSPQALYDKLVARQLSELGVSRTVADRFEEAFTEARRLELRALRSPDCQLLYLRVDGGEYREIGRLSGGRRVSLILSLLLEAHDDRPLVIDQPEDELDNEFMWETVLPALRRLKGRRQVIVATHDANIVVNGDADLVVLLEAEADHGHVAVSGAIEDPVVRTAIVETVDGGRVAFELRKAKYGF